MKNNFEDNILNKIKKKKIKPTSRFYFLAKDYGSLILFIFLIILLSIVSGIIVLFLLNTDWDIYKYSGKNIFVFTFSVVPYFWFILLAILIPLAYINFRFTDEGYRHRTSLILGGVVFIFTILGLIIYSMGISNNLENKLTKISPLYSSHSEAHMRHMWMYTDNGLVAGIIIESKPNLLIIKDLNGKKWKIDTTNTNFVNGVKNKIDDKIKIIGKKINENTLIASEIRKWGGFGCNMNYGFYNDNMRIIHNMQNNCKGENNGSIDNFYSNCGY